MLDPKKLLGDLLGSNIPGTDTTVSQTAQKATRLAKDNPLATTGLIALLVGTSAGRSIGGSALKLGGMAAVAGLAYKAYQNYQAGKSPGEAPHETQPDALLPAPQDTSFHPSQAPQGEDAFALTLVQAMISAARADGHIDDAERARITERITMSGLDGDAAVFLREELEKPVSMDVLVSAARTDAQKVELYTASRLAIEPETRAERGYLDMLAGRLKLPDALIDHVEATVAEIKT